MSTKETILRVSATDHLKVQVGQAVRQGDRVQDGSETDGPSIAPVSGTVKSIQFNPASHEFVIVIVPSV